MGGNLFKNYNIKTERIDIEKYNIVLEKILNTIKQHDFCEVEPTKHYKNKKNFGDIDILICSNNNNKLYKFIFENFSKTIVCNGNVYSFVFDDVQIDFVLISKKNWEISKVYFSYDPLGNLMGVIYFNLNFLYGDKGLFYKYKSSLNNQIFKIKISADPKKIFDFGGFNYNQYLTGFNSIEEIYDVIINSKYFNTEFFCYENLNHINRRRNKKRKSYNDFLRYLKENNINKKIEINKSQDFLLDTINSFFPESNIFEQIENIENNISKQLQIKEKFNGYLIMKWLPELKGKNLGVVIGKIKELLGNDFENYILMSSSEEIKNLVVETYNNIINK